MKSHRIRNPLPGALLPALLLIAGAASAGGKTHLGVAPDQILNLVVLAPNDLSVNTLKFDASGPDFTVPDRMVFVVTDIHVTPQSPTSAATDSYAVSIGAGVNRSHFARFFGAAYDASFSGGLVIPAGETLRAANHTASADDVIVTVRGYLTKGTALAPGTGF